MIDVHFSDISDVEVLRHLLVDMTQELDSIRNDIPDPIVGFSGIFTNADGDKLVINNGVVKALEKHI